MNLRHLSLLWLLVGGSCFVCSYVYGQQAGGERLTSVETPHFEVVGSSVRAVSFVADLSAYLVESNASMLPEVPPSFPQRVLVVLREDKPEYDGDYLITRSDGGFVRLDLIWGPDLSLERCLQAVNESFLFRYMIFNRGMDAPDSMKAWAVAALNAEAYIGIRPAMIEEYKSFALANDLPPLQEQLSAPYVQNASLVEFRAIYPMLSGLRDYGISLKDFSALLLAGLTGEDVEQTLEALIVDSELNLDALDLGAWWTQTNIDFVSVDNELFEPMDVSQLWIREMSDFSELEEIDISNLRVLWSMREEPEVKDLLGARLELIRLRMDSVNPAYFNAARSLGALYETLLNGGRKHEFISELSSFLSDFNDTRKLEAKVSQILSAQ